MTTEKLPEATIGGSYSYGWQQFKRFFLYLFLVGIVLFVANAPADWAIGDGFDDSRPAMVALLATVYSVLIRPVIDFGAHLVVLRYARNERADLGEMFLGFRNGYLNIVLANLLVVAIVIIGFIFLIVPGIILAIRLSFVPYLVMDKRLDPVAAVEKSWNMTRGRSWTIFGFWLLAIVVFFAGLLLLVIGAFFAHLWIMTSYASFYHAVDLEEQQQLDGNGAGLSAGHAA